jgi:phosphoribosylformylglycinamidine synthase
MMSNLHEIIPGTGGWPQFVRNKSEQFEARFATVEVLASPSLFFDGMAGSRLPIAVAHGEGYAEFASSQQRAQRAAARRAALRRQSRRRNRNYPYNPNGSPAGITSLTTADGRFTVLMPHPERVFRTVQNSWHPTAGARMAVAAHVPQCAQMGGVKARREERGRGRGRRS